MNTHHTHEQPGLLRRRLRLRRIALLITLAGVAYVGWWVVWAFTAKPNISIDSVSELERIVRDAQPAGENGWVLIDDARDRFDRVEIALDSATTRPPVHSNRTYYGILFDESQEDWALYNEGDYEEAVAFAQHAVELLREEDIVTPLLQARSAANLIKTDHQIQDTAEPQPIWTTMLFPRLASDRSMAVALRAEMHEAFRAKDTSRALRAAEAIFSLGHAIAMQPTAIQYLVGAAIHQVAYEGLIAYANQGDVPPDFARQVIELLEAVDTTTGFHTSIDGEFVYLRDLVQFVYSDDGDGDGIMLFSELYKHNINLAGGFQAQQRGPRLLNIAGVLFASRSEILQRIDDDLALLHAMADMPYQEARQFVDAGDADMADWRFSLYHTFRSGFTPTYNLAHSRASRDGVQILYAIEGFRSEHGRLPDSLDELETTWLASVPVDPFSGQPFIYRILKDPDEHGRTYLLYSTNADGEDNGGAHGQSKRRSPDLPFTRAADR